MYQMHRFAKQLMHIFIISRCCEIDRAQNLLLRVKRWQSALDSAWMFQMFENHDFSTFIFKTLIFHLKQIELSGDKYVHFWFCKFSDHHKINIFISLYIFERLNIENIMNITDIMNHKLKHIWNSIFEDMSLHNRFSGSTNSP